MNPPLFATVLLFLGPIAVLVGGRIVLLVLCLTGLMGALGGASACIQATILACLASYFLTLLCGRGRNPAGGVLLWVGFCTLPLWAPEGAGLWKFWPGHGLSYEQWNPIAGGWFYQTWGSGSLLQAPSFTSILLSYILLSVLFRFGLLLSGTISLRANNPDSRDET